MDIIDRAISEILTVWSSDNISASYPSIDVQEYMNDFYPDWTRIHPNVWESS